MGFLVLGAGLCNEAAGGFACSCIYDILFPEQVFFGVLSGTNTCGKLRPVHSGYDCRAYTRRCMENISVSNAEST